MARLYQCDRCSVQSTGLMYSVDLPAMKVNTGPLRVDLCDACIGMIWRFIRERLYIHEDQQ